MILLLYNQFQKLFVIFLFLILLLGGCNSNTNGIIGLEVILEDPEAVEFRMQYFSGKEEAIDHYQKNEVPYFILLNKEGENNKEFFDDISPEKEENNIKSKIFIDDEEFFALEKSMKWKEENNLETVYSYPEGEEIDLFY